MVIKGSAAKRDGERLHPAADVEQEGKKEKRGGEGGERTGCVGARTMEKKKETQQRKGKEENRRTERGRDKEGLNGDRK